MEKIFVDTSAFMAIFSLYDDSHDLAVEKFKRLPSNRLITTNFVISETYTGLMGRVGYQIVVVFDKLVEGGNFDVRWIDETQYKNARQIFLKFNKDKEWSFVDCTSYVIMKELKIKRALVFDEDFKEMGFELV